VPNNCADDRADAGSDDGADDWVRDPYIGEVVVDRVELQRRVAEIGRQITEDYAGVPLLLIGVLKGAFVFMSDLAREIDLPLEIDVMATVAGIEAAIPLLEQSTAGAIVVIGTTGAIEIAGPPRPYASAKAALVPYVKALARNLAAKNIRANMVSPGNVYFKGGVWNILEQSNPALFQTMVGRNLMGRMGTPAEVANAVVFLASPRAGFITGTNLIVDGALTQRVQY